MKEIILHIGMHKTGSTSIQSSLNKFDDGETRYLDLELMPNTWLFSKVNTNHSVPFDLMFNNRKIYLEKRGFSEDEIDKKRNKMFSSLEYQIKNSDRKRLIISAEAISLFENDNKEKLINFFLSHNLVLKVYCSVRDPVSYAKSMFLQEIFGERKHFNDIKNPEYKKCFDTFRKKLPKKNFILKIYNKDSLYNGCVVEDFCKQIGIKLKKENIKRNKNISLTLPAAKLIFYFNGSWWPSFSDKRIYQARIETINQIKVAYHKFNKLDDKFFNFLVDFSDVKYLENHFDIKFTIPSEKFDPIKLKELFLDNSDIDFSPIDELLRKNKINPSKFPNAQEKVMMLFYGILAKWENK